MNPELLELLRAARAALAAGRDTAAVDSLISKATGGRIAGRLALADHLEAGLEAPAQEPGVLLEFARRLPQAGADALVLLGAGGSLGALDEFGGAVEAAVSAGAKSSSASASDRRGNVPDSLLRLRRLQERSRRQGQRVLSSPSEAQARAPVSLEALQWGRVRRASPVPLQPKAAFRNASRRRKPQPQSVGFSVL